MGRRKQKRDINGDLIKLSEKERTGLPAKGRRTWKAPADMPDKMVKQVLAGKVCGAKLVKGGYCTSTKCVVNPNRPPPYRCKGHGGNNNSHTKPGETIGMKHGIYTDCMFDWEKDIYDQLNADSLDEEIKMTKLRLRRALKADAERDPSHLITIEELLKRAPNGEMVVIERKRSKENGYSGEINRLVKQLTSLQSQRTHMQDVKNLADHGGRSKVVIYLPDNGRMQQ